MMNKGLSKAALRLLDGLTDSFPSTVPQMFQRALLGVVGSRPVFRFYQTRYRRQWNSAEQLNLSENKSLAPQKILFVVDVCIGDTILASECLPIIRRAYPNAELHLLCNRTGGELVEGMPGIRVHNLVRGDRGMPSKEDLAAIRALLEREAFALVLNLGPFYTKKQLTRRGKRTLPQTVIQLFVPFGMFVLRAWKEDGRRHISYLARIFMQDFLALRPQLQSHGGDLADQLAIIGQSSSSRNDLLNTNSVYLSAESIAAAKAFLDSHGLTPGSGIVFFNPDATSQFGLMPLSLQKQIVSRIAEMEDVRAILIGEAFTNRGIEQDVIDSLDSVSQRKVVIVPHMSIGSYVALIDASDMYISGDTGPLHIAATKKISPKDSAPMRNRTVILAIYGATDSRMYGYDSEQPNHVPANQNAPSRAFTAPVSCRNITCVNKFGKFCSEVRCFDRLPVEEVAAYVAAYFGQLADQRSKNSRVEERSSPNRITIDMERAYAL